MKPKLWIAINNLFHKTTKQDNMVNEQYILVQINSSKTLSIKVKKLNNEKKACK